MNELMNLWFLYYVGNFLNQLSGCQFVTKVRGLCTEYCKSRGPGSSVGIVTEIRAGGPGSNPGGDKIFRPSRPALGPTQPPVKWVLGLFRGKVRPGRAADHSHPSSAAVMEE